MADITKRWFNDGTDEITCPYCGAEWSDSWEMSDSGEEICDECGNKFWYEREVSVSYTSHRISDDGEVDYCDDLIKKEQQSRRKETDGN